MLSIGALIWVSLRPLLRLVLCVGFGIIITKADIFPVVASRGAGQLLLNITGPCLMFSKIVPAFSTDNIGTLGPLFLVAFVYEALGLLLAWIVKQFFWVPHRFRYGILVAGGWGNYGDIPTSVVMSITAGPPFNSTSDQTLAVAYISAFILVFYITLFPMGGSRLLVRDYAGPDVEDDEIREAIRRKRTSLLKFWIRIVRLCFRRQRLETRELKGITTDPEKGDQDVPERQLSADIELTIGVSDISLRRAVISSTSKDDICVASVEPMLTYQPSLRLSGAPSDIPTSPVTSSGATVVQVDPTMQPAHQATCEDSCSKSVHSTEQLPETLAETTANTRRRRVKAGIRDFLIQLSTPPSMSIIVSFVISLINPIKALFVEVPNFHIAPAPDGQPPLAFVMDTATFVGAASVPLGLICLGSALARLKVPMTMEGWRALPVGAISAFAVTKIILSPILGVLICQGLTHVGVIDKDDKVLRFVCIFFSCLPTATTQVYLTQVYSPTGSAEHVSAFLVPQYALMIIFMTILTAYSLNLLF